MTPALVHAATARASAVGFGYSCEPAVGELLAELASEVPHAGRVLEIGTGTGVGLAWLMHGLVDRADVSVTSVEIDPQVAAEAASLAWPPTVQLVVGDVLPFLADQRERFDLVFADAPGGKWTGLEVTLAALRPGGKLVVDDMAPPRWHDDHHREMTSAVREVLLSRDDVTSVELPTGSGVIVSTKRALT